MKNDAEDTKMLLAAGNVSLHRKSTIEHSGFI